MSIGVLNAKAPLVSFEHMEYGLNEEASQKAGRPIPKIIPFAIIATDKFTRLEYPAEEWLANKKKAAIEGRENPDWVSRWEMQFESWKKGETLPVEGEPIKTWPALNKEQVMRLTALGYQTIEQLAEVSDTNLAVIGLDGRYLRDLARKTIEHAEKGGAQVKRIADLEQEVRDKDTTIGSLMERVAALEKQMTGRETLHAKKG